MFDLEIDYNNTVDNIRGYIVRFKPNEVILTNTMLNCDVVYKDNHARNFKNAWNIYEHQRVELCRMFFHGEVK